MSGTGGERGDVDVSDSNSLTAAAERKINHEIHMTNCMSAYPFPYQRCQGDGADVDFLMVEDPLCGSSLVLT